MASGIVAVYGGRFHPFHKGHKAVYDGLANKFGDSKVFIATSDKTGPGSPFTFKEKRAMMLLAGVPGHAIKQEISPYKPENTLSTVSKDTAVLFAVGQKDMAENPRFKPGLKKDGTATYYQNLDDWLTAGKKLEPFEKHGYLITIPSVKFTVLGKPADSATQLRAQYKTLDDEKRKEFITDLFGAYNDVIQQVMDTRLTEGDMTADKKNPIAKPYIDKPEWKALHDMDDKIIQAYIKHKEVNEELVTPTTQQVKRVQGAITKGMDEWERYKEKEYKSNPTNRTNISPKGWASDKLDVILGIDPDGTVIISQRDAGAHKVVKKLATLGGMPGVRTRPGTPEEEKNVSESPWELLKRKLDPKIHHNRYQKAAEVLHSVLKRKEKENAGKPFRHALGYYAQTIGRSFANSNIDTKALMKYYLDNFDAVMTEGVSPEARRASRLRRKAAHLQKTMAKYRLASQMGMDPARVNQRRNTPTLTKEELTTPDSPNDQDGKLSGGVSPQMIAKQLPGVENQQQLVQVLMKMKRGDTQYSRNQMIAAADAFKEIIAKDPQETQRIMMLLKKVKAESKYQFEDINFDTAEGS